MPQAVTRVQVFEKHVADAPGRLAQVLAPISGSGINLDVVWGWAEGASAVVRIGVANPSARQLSAVQAAGFTAAAVSAVCVGCGNTPGAGLEISKAIAAAGISLESFVGLGMDSKAEVVACFRTEEEAVKAAQAIAKLAPKRASTPKGTTAKMTAKKAAPKKTTVKKAAPKAAAPKKAAPKKAAPKKAAPKKAAPKKAAPKKAAPKKAAVKKAAPKKAAPKKAAPKKAAPKKAP